MLAHRRTLLAAAALVASAALADGKPEPTPACPTGQVRDANTGKCKRKYKPSRRAPERTDADAAPKKCPPGEKLQNVTCIRAPCPPQCVRIDDSKR